MTLIYKIRFVKIKYIFDKVEKSKKKSYTI